MLRYWEIDHGDRAPEFPKWERRCYWAFGVCIIAAIVFTLLGF
jgi:hypothetical protein